MPYVATACREIGARMLDPDIRDAGELTQPPNCTHPMHAVALEMAEAKQYPVVVRTEIDYRRPAVLGDKLVVHGRLDSVERSRFWCAFEIVRPADGTLIVTSRQMLALVQMPSGRPMRLPAEWSTRYAHLIA